MKTYTFGNHLKIILYGVNAYSQKLKKVLCDRNYDVCAFIDKRAKELEYVEEVEVYTLEQISSLDNLSSACVIIMLQNALQHEDIAMALYNAGFGKIIFIPMKLNSHIQLADRFRHIYNLVLLEQFGDIEAVPFYSEMLVDTKKESLEISNLSKDYVTIRVSCDAVYTNPLRVVKSNKNLLKYADIPLVAYVPYDKLFDYLQGEDNEVEEYLNDYGVNSCNYSHSFKNSDILIQRESLYHVWEEQMQNNMDFFVSSAPLAEWNSRGYFNLLEGQHRTLFLIKKGIYFVPIRVSKKDYQKIYKINFSQLVVDKISSFGVMLDTLFLKNNKKLFLTKIMVDFQKRIKRDIYYGKSVLDISMEVGYYGINFYKMGAIKVTICNEDLLERDCIEKYIQKYYSTDNIQLMEHLDYERLSEYELILLLGNSKFVNKYKKYVFSNLAKYQYENILFTCNTEEFESLSEDVKDNAYFITKIHMNGNLVKVLLYKNKKGYE